jgi:integrase
MTKPRRRQAGEGGVSAYETKAGTRYLIKYTATDPDGARRVILRRRGRDGQPFLTRKAAAAELGDVLAEVRRGDHVVPKRTTLAEWLDQWLAGLQLAPSTTSSYAKNVRLHIKPHLGQLQLQHLTGARISGLYRQLEAGGRQDHLAGQGLSPRTVRYVHTILKAALADAVDQGVLATNPAAKAKPPSARAAQSPEIHPWTGTQLRTFLTWCRDTDAAHAAGYHLLAYTGMRRGELLALRWRDVDLDAGRLSVRRSVGVVKSKGQGEQIVEGTTKSARARVVDLDPSTVDLLRSWRRDRGSLALQLVRDDALIFGTLEGGYLHPERFSRSFTDKVAQCRRKVDGTAPPAIHLHDLRHTHASLLLAAGEQIKVVSERLGHASVAITHEIYEHVMPGRQAEAAARFAAIIDGSA